MDPVDARLADAGAVLVDDRILRRVIKRNPSAQSKTSIEGRNMAPPWGIMRPGRSAIEAARPAASDMPRAARTATQGQSMTATSGRQQFEREVFPAEIEEIARRRANMGDKRPLDRVVDETTELEREHVEIRVVNVAWEAEGLKPDSTRAAQRLRAALGSPA